MKTTRSLLLVAGLFLAVCTSAEARERRGESGPPERGRNQPSQGLQLSSGLQTSTLNGSGPAPIAERLSDEDWRKMFVRKDAAK
jgi:hypothetical protein